MYLNRLSGEQKRLFLDLCIYASKADGIFAEEEKQYIQQYCVKKFDECIWRSQPFIVWKCQREIIRHASSFPPQLGHRNTALFNCLKRCSCSADCENGFTSKPFSCSVPFIAVNCFPHLLHWNCCFCTNGLEGIASVLIFIFYFLIFIVKLLFSRNFNILS